jgi:hypothetical protein
MKGWLQKYLFWMLLGVLALYWLYRQWPHSIAVQDIIVQQPNGEIAPLNISKDSITIVHFYAHWCTTKNISASWHLYHLHHR